MTAGSGPGRVSAGSVLELGRAAYGLVGLVAPDRVAAVDLGHPPQTGTRRVARLLGARHLVQALVLLATGDAAAHRAGGVLDGLHGLSMVPWSRLTRQDRRYYVVSGVVATTLAALEWQVARSAERPSR